MLRFSADLLSYFSLVDAINFNLSRFGYLLAINLDNISAIWRSFQINPFATVTFQSILTANSRCLN